MNKREFLNYAAGDQTKPKLGLSRIRQLLSLAGNPDDSLKIIQITGTNGKGSVCRFLSSILKEAGYKTGLFSSPCLINRCDAISINNVHISTEELDGICAEIGAYAADMAEMPTPFEISTVASLMYFKRNNCDYCILEVGMGGATDATNAVSKSVMSIFTPIAIDHTEYLGSTLEEIAGVKAGIIKEDSCVITSPQPSEVINILKKRAEKNSFIVSQQPVIKKSDGIYEVFDCKDYRDVLCGLGGVYQPCNAALAIEAAEYLNIDSPSICRGIANAENPARFELFKNGKTEIVFDGAHNPHGMNAFVKSVNRYFGSCPKTVIFAAMHDKDIDNMADELKMLEGNPKFYAVGVSNNSRSESSAVIAEKFVKHGMKCTNMSDINTALQKADKSNPVFVCGSLYLYKEFLAAFKSFLL